MSIQYVRDLQDSFRAIELIVDEMIAKETESLLNQVSELESEVEELQAENEILRELKAIYEGLCVNE